MDQGMSLDEVYMLAEKLKLSPGAISKDEIAVAFHAIDSNHNNALSNSEFCQIVTQLLSVELPRRVLGDMGLSPEGVVAACLSTVLVLATVFTFLLLAFQAFVGPGGGAFQAVVQSALAAGAALWRASGGQDGQRIGSTVLQSVQTR